MIIVSETIKKLRDEFGLSQTQLAKAIYVENATICQYENNKRIPTLEILEQIVNVFGYTIDINLIEKKDFKREKDFFKVKSFADISSMSEKDLTDYIYITQDDDVVANICNITTNALQYIPLENLKKLIRDVVIEEDRLTLFFKINKLHESVESEMAEMINHTKEHLYNFSLLDKATLNNIKYIDVQVGYTEEDNAPYFENIRALDEHRMDLNIDRFYIDGCDIFDDDFNHSCFLENRAPLDNVVNYKLAQYLFDKRYDGDENKIIKLYY